MDRYHTVQQMDKGVEMTSNGRGGCIELLEEGNDNLDNPLDGTPNSRVNSGTLPDVEGLIGDHSQYSTPTCLRYIFHSPFG